MQPSIRHLIQQAGNSLTPSERKLARLLTGASPAMALSTVYQFAEKAGVSPPTVVRFAVKLGFNGFTEFQRALVSELQSMLTSPISLLSQANEAMATKEVVREFGKELAQQVENAVGEMPGLESALELLADERRNIYLRGGRFSQFLAFYAHAHLRQMRKNVHLLGQSQQADLDATLDIHKRDVVILFDFRRYQDDTIRLGRYWSQSGAVIILFTDRWLSPATEYAKHVFISEVAALSAFDSLVPATAQIEYLIKLLLEKLGQGAAERLQRLEAIRENNSGWSSLHEAGHGKTAIQLLERSKE